MSALDPAAFATGEWRGLRLRFDRAAWADLANGTPFPLTEADLRQLRALGEPIGLAEVRDTYLPLSRLLRVQANALVQLRTAVTELLGPPVVAAPLIVGIAGGVAAGKSTTARILQRLIQAWPGSPRVDLVTTDGFLYPNAELTRRGIMHRKGFPESYDERALLRFLTAVRQCRSRVTAPVYSHLSYDIVPGRRLTVDRPSVLIIEGLNVLQPPRQDGRRWHLAVSDFFDFSIYVDAAPEDLRRWYVERFLMLRRTAFADPSSYFHQYATLSDEEAVATALGFYDDINEPNLTRNIRPTMPRATLILRKGGDHTVTEVEFQPP